MTTDLKKQRRQKFEDVFAKLRDDLVDHLKGENMPAEAVEWYRRVSLHPLFRCDGPANNDTLNRTSTSTFRGGNSIAG